MSSTNAPLSTPNIKSLTASLEKNWLTGTTVDIKNSQSTPLRTLTKADGRTHEATHSRTREPRVRIRKSLDETRKALPTRGFLKPRNLFQSIRTRKRQRQVLHQDMCASPPLAAKHVRCGRYHQLSPTCLLSAHMMVVCGVWITVSLSVFRLAHYALHLRSDR